MYEGYLRLGDVEIANATRVEAYVRNLLPGYPLRGCNGDPAIPLALGEDYDSPLQDGASWVDPSNPATYDFLGFYPLAIEGMDDSTTVATVTQSLGPGGFVNSARDATREIRVRGILVGKDELAVRAGFTWLDRALAQSRCDDDPTCHGATLDYFAAAPEITVCYRDPVAEEPRVVTGLAPGSLFIPATTVGEDSHYSGEFVPILGWDGLTWLWGVSHFTGDEGAFMSDPVFVSGPVTPFRTNKVNNPQFAVGTALWASTAPLTRVATGGPTGGPYGHIEFDTIPQSLTTNVSTAISGRNILQFEARTSLDTFVVNVRSALDDTVIQTEMFTGSPDWASYSLVIPDARNGVLEFEVPSSYGYGFGPYGHGPYGHGPAGPDVTGSWFDVTNVILEAATQLLPYFDGDTLPEMQPSHAEVAPVPEYAVEWLGTPNQSESRMRWLGRALYDFCGPGQYAWLSVQGGYGAILSNVERGALISAADQAHPYTRYMRDVARISGPIKQQQFYTSQGASMMVEFLLEAATPYAYNRELTTILHPLDLLTPEVFVDTTAPAEPPAVIIDPDCPPVPAPPRPPVIVSSCVVTPGTWDRYSFIVPQEVVSRWSATLPTISIESDVVDLRQLRARAYRNPLGVDFRRTNLAPRPYPNVAGGWTSQSAPSFAVSTSTGFARRVGSKTSVTDRTTTALDPRIAAWSYVGAAGTTMSDLALVTGITDPLTISTYFMTQNAPDARYAFTAYWYTNAGVLLRTDVQPVHTTISGAGRYTRIAYTPPAPPATADRLRVDVTFYTSTGANATGAELTYLQDVQIEVGATATPYFDGAGEKALNFTNTVEYPEDYNLTYSWSGTAFASPSIAEVDQFGFESEFIISYMPALSMLVVDSTVQRSEVFLPNPSVGPPYQQNAISAANLLYGQDGGPMTWPEFSCGVPYTITVDVPPGEGDGILVGMELTRRE